MADSGKSLSTTELDPDAAQRFAAVLEGRRLATEQAQWQAPGLTIAAQAFLLNVLADDDVSHTARLVILIAGVLACAAAFLSLVRLRAREMRFSEAVSEACKAAELPDPRPYALPPLKLEKARGLDKALLRWGDSERPPRVYIFWLSALVAFALADGVTIWCTW